jgi:hypothetical protein
MSSGNEIKLSDLDRPICKVDKETLYSCAPFFNDYHVTFFIKPVKSKIFPLLVGDFKLAEWYYANTLSENIKYEIKNVELIKSPTFKILFKILVLKNNWLACYIEKKCIWDLFQSVGIIVILGPDHNAVLNYFEKYHDKLFKTKWKRKGIKEHSVH